MNLNYYKLYGLLTENEPNFLDLVPYFQKKRLEKKEKNRKKFQEIAKNEVTEEEILSFGKRFYFRFEAAKKTNWEKVTEEEFNKKFIEERNSFSFYNFAPSSIILQKTLKHEFHKNIEDIIWAAVGTFCTLILVMIAVDSIMIEKLTFKERSYIFAGLFIINIIMTIFSLKKYICKEKKYFREQDRVERDFFEEKMKEKGISLSCDEFEKKFKKLKEFYEFSEGEKCLVKLVDEIFSAIYLNAPKDEAVKEAIKDISEWFLAKNLFPDENIISLKVKNF